MDQEVLDESQKARSALSSDSSWVSCDMSLRNTATHAQDSVSDDFVVVPTPSPQDHHRPGQLDYSKSSSSEIEGGTLTQETSNTFSPSSMYACRHGSSVTPTTSTPPTPAPRAGLKIKQLEEEKSKLHQQLESLQKRILELERQLQNRPGPSVTDEGTQSLQERIEQLEDQNAKLKRASSSNTERLTEKISQLELSSMNSDQEIIQLKQQLVTKQHEMDQAKHERFQLEQSLTLLRIEKEQMDGERRILEKERDKLKQEMRSSPTTEQAPGVIGRSTSVSSRDHNVLRRLNDTLRDKKLIEEKVITLEREMNTLKADKLKLEQDGLLKIQQLQEDNEQIKKENEQIKLQQLAKAEQEKRLLWQQLEEARDQLRESQQTLEIRAKEMNDLQERRNFIEQQYREIRQKLEVAEGKLVDYQNLLTEKEVEMDQANREKESYQSQIKVLETQIETVTSTGAREKTALQTELQQAKHDRDMAQTARNQVSAELSAVKQAKQKGETLQDALKKEAQYIMTDLEEVNAKLAEAEQERDRVTHRKDKVMNELAKRNEEIHQRDKEINQLKDDLKAKTEQMTILDVQLKTYHEDFETERIAREKMAGKLEQVTSEVQQLREELKMKDKEVKRLHSHLNRSAANQMKAEMEMEFLASHVGVGDYSSVQSPMQLDQEGQPLRAGTRTPQGAGGPYQMHTPR